MKYISWPAHEREVKLLEFLLQPGLIGEVDTKIWEIPCEKTKENKII